MAITMGLLIIFGRMNRMGFILIFFSCPIQIGFLNGIAPSINANQEMRAIGFAVTGAGSRTSVNIASGGKTQLVSVVTALTNWTRKSVQTIFFILAIPPSRPSLSGKRATMFRMATTDY
jgi:MFS superfamily sulfate permease-like transporter